MLAKNRPFKNKLQKSNKYRANFCSMVNGEIIPSHLNIKSTLPIELGTVLLSPSSANIFHVFDGTTELNWWSELHPFPVHGHSLELTKVKHFNLNRGLNREYVMLHDIHSISDLVAPSKNAIEINVEEIYEIDRKGFHSEAMKLMYDFVYDMLIIQEYNECNLYIEYFLPRNFSLELQVALTRITKPHHKKLKNRENLVFKLKENLKKECSQQEAESVISHVV